MPFCFSFLYQFSTRINHIFFVYFSLWLWSKHFRLFIDFRFEIIRFLLLSELVFLLLFTAFFRNFAIKEKKIFSFETTSITSSIYPFLRNEVLWYEFRPEGHSIKFSDFFFKKVFLPNSFFFCSSFPALLIQSIKALLFFLSCYPWSTNMVLLICFYNLNRVIIFVFSVFFLNSYVAVVESSQISKWVLLCVWYHMLVPCTSIHWINIGR